MITYRPKDDFERCQFLVENQVYTWRYISLFRHYTENATETFVCSEISTK